MRRVCQISPQPQKAEGVGVEPTRLLHSTVFKTAAVANYRLALPYFQIAREGFEPPFPDSESDVLPLDDLAVGRPRFERGSVGLQPSVLARLYYRPKGCWERIRTSVLGFKGPCPTVRRPSNEAGCCMPYPAVEPEGFEPSTLSVQTRRSAN